MYGTLFYQLLRFKLIPINDFGAIYKKISENYYKKVPKHIKIPNHLFAKFEICRPLFPSFLSNEVPSEKHFHPLKHLCHIIQLLLYAILGSTGVIGTQVLLDIVYFDGRSWYLGLRVQLEALGTRRPSWGGVWSRSRGVTIWV